MVAMPISHYPRTWIDYVHNKGGGIHIYDKLETEPLDVGRASSLVYFGIDDPEVSYNVPARLRMLYHIPIFSVSDTFSPPMRSLSSALRTLVAGSGVERAGRLSQSRTN